MVRQGGEGGVGKKCRKRGIEGDWVVEYGADWLAFVLPIRRDYAPYLSLPFPHILCFFLLPLPLPPSSLVQFCWPPSMIGSLATL